MKNREAYIKDVKEISSYLSKRRSLEVPQSLDVFKGINLNEHGKLLKETEPNFTKKEQEIFNKNLRSVRKKLIETEHQDMDTKFTRYYYLSNIQPNSTILPVLARISNPDGGQGQEPDVVMWPNTNENVRIKEIDSGSGLGCFNRPVVVHRKEEVLYQFVPTELASWIITTAFDYSGFYILTSQSGLCKYAEVQFLVRINLFQSFLRTEETHIIFERKIDITQSFNLFLSGFRQLTYPGSYIRTNDPVYLIVTFEVRATAYGDGCYAEINFEDGPRNYINPIVSWANKF